VLDGPYNNDATALPNGGHPNQNVVADDHNFVEHLGNAGRPQATDSRPDTMHTTINTACPKLLLTAGFTQETFYPGPPLTFGASPHETPYSALGGVFPTARSASGRHRAWGRSCPVADRQWEVSAGDQYGRPRRTRADSGATPVASRPSRPLR
jgi:hypothetical protein